MPRLKFTAETMPKSSEEFQRILREALESTSPLDDFIELVRDLVLLEQQYDMDSAQLYERFQRGELGDNLDYFDWATKFEMYCQAKEEIEQVLEVLDLYPLPMPARVLGSIATSLGWKPQSALAVRSRLRSYRFMTGPRHLVGSVSFALGCGLPMARHCTSVSHLDEAVGTLKEVEPYQSVFTRMPESVWESAALLRTR